MSLRAFLRVQGGKRYSFYLTSREPPFPLPRIGEEALTRFPDRLCLRLRTCAAFPIFDSECGLCGVLSATRNAASRRCAVSDLLYGWS
jgi:hypothetical protein